MPKYLKSMVKKPRNTPKYTCPSLLLGMVLGSFAIKTLPNSSTPEINSNIRMWEGVVWMRGTSSEITEVVMSSAAGM